MDRSQTQRNERDRKARLIRETVRYGVAAVVFAGIATALWFLQRPLGIAAVAVVAAFAALAIGNFLVGFFIWRAFTKLSADPAAPHAFVNEYGHLELFGGERDQAQKYAEFCAGAYGKMYRPVVEKPGKEDTKAAKQEQKRLLSEEKTLKAPLTPYRQFDNFNAADLRALHGKVIFVSERMVRLAAQESDWQAAKKNNEIVIIRGPVLGRKTGGNRS